jgi:hypothetical protein
MTNQLSNLYIIIASILGSVICYYINVHLKKGAVLGSALVVLLSGIFYPNFFNGAFGLDKFGSTLAAASTCGSYAGMINAKHVPNLFHMIVIGFINGALFIVSANVYIGIGGRLGTISAISCITWLGARSIYKRLFHSHSLKLN